MPSALGAITHTVSAYLSRRLLSSASCSSYSSSNFICLKSVPLRLWTMV